jgi:hypothetical protein
MGISPRDFWLLTFVEFFGLMKMYYPQPETMTLEQFRELKERLGDK